MTPCRSGMMKPIDLPPPVSGTAFPTGIDAAARIIRPQDATELP